VCRSYSDFNFGITFFGTQCIIIVVPLECDYYYCYYYCIRRIPKAAMYHSKRHDIKANN